MEGECGRGGAWARWARCDSWGRPGARQQTADGGAARALRMSEGGRSSSSSSDGRRRRERCDAAGRRARAGESRIERARRSVQSVAASAGVRAGVRACGWGLAGCCAFVSSPAVAWEGTIHAKPRLTQHHGRSRIADDCEHREHCEDRPTLAHTTRDACHARPAYSLPAAHRADGRACLPACLPSVQCVSPAPPAPRTAHRARSSFSPAATGPAR